jgi:transposase
VTTKIHVIVDALGNSVAMSLTPRQASDLGQAAPLLDQVEPREEPLKRSDGLCASTTILSILRLLYEAG